MKNEGCVVAVNGRNRREGGRDGDRRKEALD